MHIAHPNISFKGAENDEVLYEDYERAWKLIIEQNVALICYKSGSDEVIGISMNYVNNKEDQIMEKFSTTVSY